MRGIFVAVLGVALAASGVASAQVLPGNIPADSIQSAYSIQPNTTYRGAFRPDTATYHDLDYLAFTVASAGETLEFTVQNTTQPCNDPNDLGCPVYATLMDGTNNQIGGSSSDAGTIATYADTELLDWTFAAPGTYYLLMESNGDEPPGSPSYAISYRPLSGPGGAGGGTSGGTAGPPGSGQSPGTGAGRVATLVQSLRVFRHQRGTAVTARVTLGQQARWTLSELLIPRRHRAAKVIAVSLKGPLSIGRHRLVTRLPAAYRRKLRRTHRMSLILRIGFLGVSGQRHVFDRDVTLKP